MSLNCIEIGVASEISIMCGPYALSGMDFDRFFWALDASRATEKSGTDSESRITNQLRESRPLQLWKSREELQSTPLHRLLVAREDAKCSDLRDKLYALMNLASDVTLKRYQEIDYTKSTLELFCDVICFCSPHSLPWDEVVSFGDVLHGLLNIPYNFDVDACNQPSNTTNLHTFDFVSFPAGSISFEGCVVGVISKIDCQADSFGIPLAKLIISLRTAPDLGVSMEDSRSCGLLVSHSNGSPDKLKRECKGRDKWSSNASVRWMNGNA